MNRETVDLGSGFSYRFFCWEPGDLELNPQNAGLARIDKAGITIWKDGKCEGACWFDTPETQAVPGEQTAWQLVSLDPLHIEPSIQMYRFDWETKQHVPSHHGYIRDGRWVSA